MSDEWINDWEATVASVGQDFGVRVESAAIDAIELGAIRKFCEPLEFDCPLHYEAAVARQYGYRDVLAPYGGGLLHLDQHRSVAARHGHALPAGASPRRHPSRVPH